MIYNTYFTNNAYSTYNYLHHLKLHTVPTLLAKLALQLTETCSTNSAYTANSTNINNYMEYW